MVDMSYAEVLVMSIPIQHQGITAVLQMSGKSTWSEQIQKEIYNGRESIRLGVLVIMGEEF